mmetsp:Transcript_108654/g.307276  ORF Transcript_108654/g.307276 Transcript_108654/m.307276 type:complete len:190 (+) Transcript_108654:92-661(+)
MAANGMASEQLAPLVGKYVTMTLVGGVLLGPGRFGDYDYFRAADPTIPSQPGTFGLKNEAGMVFLEPPANIKSVKQVKANTHANVQVSGTFGALVKEGTLEKYATTVFCGWQRRLFRLHEHALVYYTENMEHMKMIRLADLQDVDYVGDELHVAWKDVSGTVSTHRLRGEAMKEWYVAIMTAVGYSPTE